MKYLFVKPMMKKTNNERFSHVQIVWRVIIFIARRCWDISLKWPEFCNRTIATIVVFVVDIFLMQSLSLGAQIAYYVRSSEL